MLEKVFFERRIDSCIEASNIVISLSHTIPNSFLSMKWSRKIGMISFVCVSDYQ